MYNPASFKEERLEVLHELIEAQPLGLLISNGENGPLATSIPFILAPEKSSFGTLQAHLARANPHWKTLDNEKVLIVFQGPNAYISPKWYPSKEEHGMVVPTWNYAMVQARGTLKVIDDATWIKRQITALTNHQEKKSEVPWKISDAPDDYIDSQIKAIIGIEIKIDQIEGKWKMSQNRNLQDRNGVIDNLRINGETEISDLVQTYSEANK